MNDSGSPLTPRQRWVRESVAATGIGFWRTMVQWIKWSRGEPNAIEKAQRDTEA
jgi:hypothetical protein